MTKLELAEALASQTKNAPSEAEIRSLISNAKMMDPEAIKKTLMETDMVKGAIPALQLITNDMDPDDVLDVMILYVDEYYSGIVTEIVDDDELIEKAAKVTELLMEELHGSNS